MPRKNWEGDYHKGGIKGKAEVFLLKNAPNKIKIKLFLFFFINMHNKWDTEFIPFDVSTLYTYNILATKIKEQIKRNIQLEKLLRELVSALNNVESQ